MNKRKEEQKSSSSRKSGKLGVVVFIIIIVIVIAGALVYGLNASSQSQTSIGVFESNFDSASNVSIVVTGYVGSNVSLATDCALNLIEQLTVTHGPAHKASTMINFYVINSTICIYSTQFGTPGSNYTHTTPSNCASMSKKVPSIFINYSATNFTSITPTALRLSGDASFLEKCGVASEITAT